MRECGVEYQVSWVERCSRPGAACSWPIHIRIPNLYRPARATHSCMNVWQHLELSGAVLRRDTNVSLAPAAHIHSSTAFARNARPLWVPHKYGQTRVGACAGMAGQSIGGTHG